ncbi:MAG: methylmalonyl Co-A mutase-associated GTPase MeaB [Oscillospiraceae bacterium]|nr:methylmalonyl Co-A mutase-associated GTPase MeaB [Oscillospiraceae bacterium]
MKTDTADIADLISRGRRGDKRAAARLISSVEKGGLQARSVLAELWPHTGKARILGVTGPPGSGKSTLTDRIVKYLRCKGIKIGVLAIDPTSPFTGGAVLGDRVRMGDLTPDPGVFIRSMGTRGRLGGLSNACAGAADVFDACGFDLVIIETAGVGQSEVEVAGVADIVAVVTVPGLGDDIQAVKAGIFEIGDILVVNKADRPEADRAVSYLKEMTETGEGKKKHNAPILKVSALENTGIGELCTVIEERFETFAADGTANERRSLRLRQTIKNLIHEDIDRRVTKPAMTGPKFQAIFEEFSARRENPYLWANDISGIIAKGKLI